MHFRAFHDVTPLWQSFEPNVLVYNHRQGNDSAWTATLNRFRIGQVTEEDAAVLMSRKTDEPFLIEDALHVFYRNVDVTKHNEKMLRTLQTPEVTIKALKALPYGYKVTVSQIGIIDNTPFMDELNLKVGARISLVSNICITDDLVNGTMGSIVAFEKNTKGEVYAVIVKFDDSKCGKRQRDAHPILSEKYKDVSGTPIFHYELEYQVCSSRGKSQAARAKILQIPMRLAWAFTCHKVQVSKLFEQTFLLRNLTTY